MFDHIVFVLFFAEIGLILDGSLTPVLYNPVQKVLNIEHTCNSVSFIF